MNSKHAHEANGRPSGGVQLAPGRIRRWRWDADAPRSQPQRCRREQWYLIRADADAASPGEHPAARDPTDDPALPPAGVTISFWAEQRCALREFVQLAPYPGQPRAGWLGWIQAPKHATHLRLHADAPIAGARWSRVHVIPVAERDPVSHPLANVPCWDADAQHSPPRAIAVPRALAGLERLSLSRPLEIPTRMRSLADLAAVARDGLGVLDPELVRSGRVTWAQLERLAVRTRVVVDLESAAALLRGAGMKTARCVTLTAESEIMSARVQYSDFATRGFALQDVLPYCTFDARHNFSLRALLANKAWRYYADQTDFPLLLSGETPWTNRNGDVLLAARAAGRGELILSDLPWLACGELGQPLAPRLIEHLMRMLCGEPLTDGVQYWTPSEDIPTLIRDIADAPRRYPSLRAARWASRDGLARLGLHLPAQGGPPRRHLLIQTGRVDRGGAHNGWPAEPLLIFCKWLARQAATGSPWALRNLRQVATTWQFDTADGLRYAAMFPAFPGEPAGVGEGVHVRFAGQQEVRGCSAIVDALPGGDGGALEFDLRRDLGVFGDGSIAFQSRLQRALTSRIEALAAQV